MPSARRATSWTASATGSFVFLSTPSARRATYDTDIQNKSYRISIHALREEGDRTTCRSDSPLRISIHALREEGDVRVLASWRTNSVFLSTPSARRATQPWWMSWLSLWDFYPRPPRGGRHPSKFLHRYFTEFLSTPSARRATVLFVIYEPSKRISIHALREEGDQRVYADAAYLGRFLSTPSARRATCSTW